MPPSSPVAPAPAFPAGPVPSEGAIVLCLVHMTEIIAVDPANLTLRAQPGAITADIDAAAATHGLFYPPDPGSMKISTIGGNIAENSRRPARP